MWCEGTPSGDGICLPGRTAAQPLPGVTDQWIHVDIFDGLIMSFVFPVRATAAGGLSHIDPVGGSVAGSAKAIRIHESFQQERTMAVVIFPIVRQLPCTQRQDLAGQSFDPD